MAPSTWIRRMYFFRLSFSSHPFLVHSIRLKQYGKLERNLTTTEGDAQVINNNSPGSYKQRETTAIVRSMARTHSQCQ